MDNNQPAENQSADERERDRHYYFDSDGEENWESYHPKPPPSSSTITSLQLSTELPAIITPPTPTPPPPSPPPPNQKELTDELFLVCTQGQVIEMKRLIAEKADPNGYRDVSIDQSDITNTNNSLLHAAALSNNAEVLQYVTKELGLYDIMKEIDYNGHTAFEIAIRNGHLISVEYLIKHCKAYQRGANQVARDNDLEMHPRVAIQPYDTEEYADEDYEEIEYDWDSGDEWENLHDYDDAGIDNDFECDCDESYGGAHDDDINSDGEIIPHKPKRHILRLSQGVYHYHDVRIMKLAVFSMNPDVVRYLVNYLQFTFRNQGFDDDIALEVIEKAGFEMIQVLLEEFDFDTCIEPFLNKNDNELLYSFQTALNQMILN